MSLNDKGLQKLLNDVVVVERTNNLCLKVLTILRELRLPEQIERVQKMIEDHKELLKDPEMAALAKLLNVKVETPAVMVELFTTLEATRLHCTDVINNYIAASEGEEK